MIRTAFLTLFVLSNLLLAQSSIPSVSTMTQGENQTPLNISTMELSAAQISALPKTTNLNFAVDPELYRVDAGDQFIVKIDLKGPALKIYQATVTPEGYVLIPETQSIYVKHRILNQARKEIIRTIKQKFPDAFIEVFLFQLHQLSVNFTGFVRNEKKLNFVSNIRLFEAVQEADLLKKQFIPKKIIHSTTPSLVPAEGSYFVPNNLDSLREPSVLVTSLRKVKIIRDGKEYYYDLLKYKTYGNKNLNPYLIDGDIVSLSAYDEKNGIITVNGAVTKSRSFEYIPGDRLIDGLKFAGGLLPGADSSRIELYRYNSQADTLKRYYLNLPADSAFPLKAQDIIMVRFKSQKIKRAQVRIIGEVSFPGLYPIQENRTTLKELIMQAGGYTSQASLSSAKLFRTKFFKGEEHLAAYLKSLPQNFDINLLSYIQVRSREEVRIIPCDFKKLFLENDTTQDIVLRDKDVIYIPQSIGIVYVSGAVMNPGTYEYHAGWKYEDYIQAAGGYTHLARKRAVRIIQGDTGVWYDHKDRVTLRPGDMIFVPEKNEIPWRTWLKDTVVIAGQIATVLILIYQVAGAK